MTRRNISEAAWAAMTGSQSATPFTWLLTIDADGSIIRLCNNPEEVVSRGVVFLSFPFMPEIPSDEKGSISTAKIVIDNVSRQLIDEIRTVALPMKVLMEIVLLDTPDVVEASFHDFTLKNVSYDALSITGDLSLEDFASEPYPKDLLTANLFPGMF